MKKRILSVFLALALLCAVLPSLTLSARAETESGDCGENLTWSYDTDTGALVITGSGAMEDYVGNSLIEEDPFARIEMAPWYYSYMLNDCGVTSVSLPEGLTSIGDRAFYSGGMFFFDTVSIPDTVTRIGEEAFYNCTSLTELTIPYSVTYIGTAAFYNCQSLTSIDVDPNNQSYCSIDGVLYNKAMTELIRCPGRKTGVFHIPESVTSIAETAFSGCTELTEITIPNGVKEIAASAFSWCTGLTRIVIPDSVTSIGAGSFYGCASLTEITIPNGVKEIASSTFSGCRSLTDVIIPEGVQRIGHDAFNACKTLTNISIPDSVEKIEYLAFYGSAFDSDPASWPDGVLYVDNWVVDAYNVGDSVALRAGTRGIAEYAFEYRSSFTSITFPESLTYIGRGAFSNCYKLGSVELPDGVVSIGDNAFDNCSSLKSVTIGRGLETIGAKAFNTDGLLTSITVDPGNPNFSSTNNVVFNKDQTELVLCSCGKTGEYQIPDSVKHIDDYAFYACEKLTGVIIPSSVASIGNSAFYQCSISSISIPDSVTTIDNWAFGSCSGLNSVTIGSSVESLGEAAFHSCSSLTEVTLPDSVKSIGIGVFNGCNSLEAVTLSNQLESISDSAFFDCRSLKNIEIPDSVTLIENYAFGRCNHLEYVTIPASVTSISDLAFYNCEALKEIRGYRGSAAEEYAERHGYSFTVMDSDPCASGHAFGEWTLSTAPTCTESGQESRTCSRCGETEMRTVAALGHTWDNGKVTKEPTETQTGVRTFTCTRCGETRTEIIPATTHVHSYTAQTVAPTCTEQGYTLHTCSGCGDSYQDSFVAPLGHNFGGWGETKAATCTAPGEEARTCKRCGEKETRTIPAKGHDYRASVTAPTCTKPGYTTHTCSACGDSYRDAETPALGHDFQDGVCTRCGEKDPDVTLNPFKDVKEDAYYAAPVAWAVENGITNGTSSTTFSPDKTCTRAQVVTFLWRAEGEPEPESAANPFNDVKPEAYYYKAVLWAVEKGITNGTGPNAFSPDKGCTRGQVVTFQWRAAGQPEPKGKSNPFTDVSSDAYYSKAVLWAVEKGVTKGTSTDKFSPDSTCTRGQIVTFLYRAEQK